MVSEQILELLFFCIFLRKTLYHVCKNIHLFSLCFINVHSLGFAKCRAYRIEELFRDGYGLALFIKNWITVFVD